MVCVLYVPDEAKESRSKGANRKYTDYFGDAEQREIDLCDFDNEQPGNGRGKCLFNKVQARLKEEAVVGLFPSYFHVQVLTAGNGVQGAGVASRFPPRCRAAMLALVKSDRLFLTGDAAEMK